jgi:hypothetical protein
LTAIFNFRTGCLFVFISLDRAISICNLHPSDAAMAIHIGFMVEFLYTDRCARKPLEFE